MASATIFVGAGTDLANGDAVTGGTSWGSTGNITAEDGSGALLAGYLGPGVSRILGGTLSTNTLGDSIPAGSIITGIKIEAKCKITSLGTLQIAQIIKSAGVYSSNLVSVAPNLTSSYVWYSYGGETELGGLTLTRDDVINSAFGMLVQFVSGDASSAFNVDAMKITIYFIYAPGGGAMMF